MLLLAATPASPQSSNLYVGGGWVAVDFVDTISGDDTQPTVQLGFNGSGASNPFTMDTGSVGILASSQYFTPGPDAKRLGEGSQYYSSDHRTEYGVWWEATQQIYSNGVLVAEAKVPVLQVTHEKRCDANGGNCQWNYSPDVHMMGVGFAREGAVGQTDPSRHSPEYNAFLNLTAVAVTPGGPLTVLPDDWHNGYVVSGDQVQLGLTTSNTANAGFIKLAPNPTYFTPTNKEWSLVPASITVDSQPPVEGTVLMDTGLKPGILTPTGTVGHFTCGQNECADHSTYLAISLPTGGFQIFSYEFQLNVSDPMRPHEVHLPGGTDTYFNTGLRVFNGINLIFDADNGFTGYQLASSGAGSPTINMWMALGGPFTVPDGFTSSLPLVLFGSSTLSPEGSAEFTAIITGSSSNGLTIDGPGTVRFTAFNAYTGPTTVTRGRLGVDGSIVSPVEVQNGGVLGGTGVLGANVTIGAGGIYAPGNSIGSQIIVGNLSFDLGGVFEVEVDPTTSDQAGVFGSIDLTGAVLQLLIARSRYAPVTSYEIIDNLGGTPAIGTFAQVISPFIFFLPYVDYDFGADHDVMLTLRRSTDFSAVARTPNERAVAEALETLPQDSPVFEAIQFQATAAGAQQAFNALSGEVHATVSSTLANDSHYVRDILMGRLVQAYYARTGGNTGAVAGLASGGPMAVAGLGNASPMGLGISGLGMGASDAVDPQLGVASPITFWTQGYGAWADFNGNGNAAGANRTLGGFLSGMDAMFADGWRIGGALGYAQTDVSVGSRLSSADVDSYQLAAYTSGQVGSFVVRGGGVWSWSSIDTDRSIVFPGFFEQVEASYNANTGQVFGEVALPLNHSHIAYEPFTGLAWVGVDTGSFTEGGGFAALTSSGANDSVGYMTLGLRAAGSMLIDGMEVVPRGSLTWLHAFGDVDPDQSLAFATFGQSFVVSGVPLAQDSALIDAGFDVILAPNATAGIVYTGQFADNVQDNAVTGRATWRF
ncbi:autotransporter family protein [Hyphomicrobium album]|uniref:autotransporter family protein n=1 Tax=Hyphomicrobium album TaxID=2665159 RepID=UPI0018A8A0F2|nr:autotransporter domain-containing protein [Hyphomicrobium album]